MKPVGTKEGNDGLDFPASQVSRHLKAALLDAVKTEATVTGANLPSNDQEIAEFDYVIDSLVAVDLICAVEPILDLEIKDEIVQSGGYDSVQHALDHLLQGIELAWRLSKGESK